jgi:hypothetical protein
MEKVTVERNVTAVGNVTSGVFLGSGRTSSEVGSSAQKSIRSTNGPLRIVAFFCFTILAIFACDWLIDSGLRRVDTGPFGEFNRIVDGEINASVLITGSSRAVNHYDPRVITSRTGHTAYNIGINGSQTDMQLAILKTYLNHNTTPSLVVHNLDSFAFVTSRAGVAFSEGYLPYLDEAPIYETLKSVDHNWWKSRYLPLYGYAVDGMGLSWMVGLQRWLGINPRAGRYLGFAPRSDTWTEEFERFRRANPDGVRFEVEPQGVLDLEQLVVLCQKRGIEVVLVYSPVYYEMQKLELDRDATFKRFSDIATRHRIQLWDYSQSPLSFSRDYFANSQHLNRKGAALFSADLAEKLANLVLGDTRGNVGGRSDGRKN